MTTRTVGTTTYTQGWDAENRLVTVSGAGVSASFSYDGDGMRVKGTVNGTVTAYVGNWFEWTGSTSTMKKYYYAGAQRIAMRTGSGTGTSGLLWIIGDHLGSTSEVANYDGSFHSQRRYRPWGEWRFGGTLPTTYRYTGQRQEDQLGGTDGLYYYGARWYDAALGRWLSPDSIIPEAVQGVQAWSRNLYVNNAPISYSDPSGNIAWFVPGAIGAAVGGIVGGALYYANNRNTCNSREFWTAVGAGALAGGLIGSGAGLLAQPATSAALATAATAITGAGTGAAGSSIGYTLTNQDSFETSSFIETTAVGGAVGGISAITPLSSLGVAAKGLTYIAGAETLYAMQTDNWTVSGAQQAAVFGAIGAGLDVAGSLAVQNYTSQSITTNYPSRNPLGYLPPNGYRDLLKVAARYRSGGAVINAGTGIVTGTAASGTTWMISRMLTAE